MKKARINDNKIVITFNKISSESFKKIHAWVSSLPKKSRSFNMKSKEWTIECTTENYEKLREFNFDLPSDLVLKMSNLTIDESWKSIEMSEGYPYLYPDQELAVKYALTHDTKVILNSEMGSGKTLTSLVICDICNFFPLLVFTPTAVKYSWVRNYENFLNKGDRIKVLDTTKDLYNYDGEADIVITNYQLVARQMKKIKTDNGFIYMPTQTLQDFYNTKFESVIIDEIHYCKNPESQTSQAVKYMTNDAEVIIGLSGTVVINSSKDLFAPLNIMRPETFNNYYRFCKRYCYESDRYVGKRKVQGNFYGARNESELYLILQDVSLRQNMEYIKEMRGEEYLKPNISVLPMRVKQSKKYKEAEKIFGVGLNSGDDKKSSLGKLNKLRVSAWNEKKTACYEFIDDMLEETVDEKVVIYIHNKILISDLLDKYRDSMVFIDGSVQTKDNIRDGIVEKFISDKNVRLIVLSIMAGNAGIDLLQTVSTKMIFLQEPWTEAVKLQCYGRLSNRTNNIGRTSIYHLILENSVEELFLKLQDKKAKIMKNLQDGELFDEEEGMVHLFEYYKEKYTNETLNHK